MIERGFRSRGFELLARAEIELATSTRPRTVSSGRRGCGWLGFDGRTADALRARAALELARGEPGAALRHAELAAEAADRAGLPIDAARGRALAARAEAEAGDVEGGRAKLERALDELGALGAGHYADQAAAELRRLGVRSPAVSASRAPRARRSQRPRARDRRLVAAGSEIRRSPTRCFLSVARSRATWRGCSASSRSPLGSSSQPGSTRPRKARDPPSGPLET